tara:strand:+ start:182 stop:445 length:264 start_codon:yes stop_codon:yes gene_type:complete
MASICNFSPTGIGTTNLVLPPFAVSQKSPFAVMVTDGPEVCTICPAFLPVLVVIPKPPPRRLTLPISSPLNSNVLSLTCYFIEQKNG